MAQNELLGKFLQNISTRTETSSNGQSDSSSLNIQNLELPDNKSVGKKSIPKGKYTDEQLLSELNAVHVPVLGGKIRNGIQIHYVPCINESGHSGDSGASQTAVWVYNGYPVFKCHHEHCQHLKWQDFAEAHGIAQRKTTGLEIGSNHYFASFYEYNNDGNPTKTLDPVICDWICQEYTFFVMKNEIWFLTDSGKYEVDDTGVKMKRIIKSCLVPRLCKTGTIEAIYKMVLTTAEQKEYEELNDFPRTWVAFQNGLFDPIQWTMTPIRPEHYLIYQVPHVFDPDSACSCTQYSNLLNFQIPDETDKNMLLEFFGLCFTRDTSPQKLLILKGRGGTGKSTHLNILTTALGSKNVSHQSMRGLTERFGATCLLGRLANVCGDIDSRDLKETDVIKKIVGEDQGGTVYEKKGKDAFSFTPFCKLVFSANRIPLNRDEPSNAFYRRLLVVIIDIPPEKADPHLERKLDLEIDGIIHCYMEALHRFYQRGGLFLESERSRAEIRQLRHNADSVAAFVDDRLIRGAGKSCIRSEVYKAYEAYCAEMDRRYPVTRNSLYSRLRDYGFTESKDSTGNCTFRGFSIMPASFEAVDEQEKELF